MSRLFLLILSALFVSCSTEKKFDFPLNEMTSIKGSDYRGEPFFKAIILTPQHYFSNASGEVQELTCGFLYQGMEASIKIVVDYERDELRFESIGAKSDYFVSAIGELYEEPVSDAKMKTSFACNFYDGEPEDRSLLANQQIYKVNYNPDPDTGRGSVEMIVTINMSHAGVTIAEKWSGIAKANFVKAFQH